MIKRQKRNIKGMTIPEVLISTITGAVLIGIVLSMWYFAYRNWTVENVRTRLRVNLEIAMERIKEELRLSSVTYMSLYMPGARAEYKALSFPVATRDADGFFDTVDGNINWDRSVIYHVHNPGTGPELRRTEFTGNHDILIDETLRYNQLKDVVDSGDYSGWTPIAGERGTTKLVFKGLADLTIMPQSQRFDGYSQTTKRSDNIKFGSIRLNPGYHDLRFEVVGKNANSSGYQLGIDTLSITPSGGLREAEVYTPFNSSGDTSLKVYSEGWSGNNYLEYRANEPGDYVTLRLYYDLWRECNFDNSTRINTVIAGNELCAKLAMPKEGAEICWQAGAQTGKDAADYGSSFTDSSLRNILASDNIDQNGNLIRVKFVAHSVNGLTINEARIAERISGDDAKPLTQLSSDVLIGATTVNVISTADFPGSGSAYLYTAGGLSDMFDYTGTTVTSFTGVTGITEAFSAGDDVGGAGKLLYFSDDPVLAGEEEPDGAGEKIGDDGGTAPGSKVIPAGYYTWSNWAEFTIDQTKDYFVTFYMPLSPESYVTYWEGPVTVPATKNSYSRTGNHATESAWNGTGTTSPDIFAVETAENWVPQGTIESKIYDTKWVSAVSPDYNIIQWDSHEPDGTSISVEARASDDEHMAGATSWSPVTNGGALPGSMDGLRYAQFKTAFTISPPYADYPWVDNVTIDWPGEPKICDISGYFTQKPDYGVIELTVDGQELTKGLEFKVMVYEDFQDKRYETSLTSEVKPRNTGR